MDYEYLITSNGELYHHGIKGMKWGIRRYQNEDGSLTPAGYKRLMKKDQRWAKKNSDRITAKAKKLSQRELNEYGNSLLKLDGAFKTNGKLSAKTVNTYNQKMAELMSQKTTELKAPSGRVVSFVAKRGELGVFMVLSNSGYNPNEFRTGVYGDGRKAYTKKVLNKINI